MKNYALYLLILCLAVTGCQKDIAENEADLTAKKDKNCKCKKERYLPVMILEKSLDFLATDTVRIKYHDKKGNISCVTSSQRKGAIKFHYNNNNELQRVDYYDDGYFLITNKDGKLDKCSYYRSDSPSTPYFDLIFNSSESDTLTVLERYDDDTEYKPRYFLYTDVNLPQALTFSYTYSSSEYAYNIVSNNKNNWAKDVNNKELLFYISISGLYIFPTQNNISELQRYDFIFYKQSTYSNFQYNDANYPVFFNRLLVIATDIDEQYFNDQFKIYYEKVNN
ncbi:hypothetical protein D3C80_917620 [compost metagenome]